MIRSVIGWSKSLSQNVLIFIVFTFIALYLVFPGRVYSIEWIASAIIILSAAIWGINQLSKKWDNISEKKFVRRLFWYAFLIRFLVMLVLLAISYHEWNMFYYVGAKDEMFYYRIASEASVIWKNFGISDAINHILINYRNELSDIGFSIFLSIPIRIFGQHPVLIKILLCLIGSLSVIRTYKLASLLIDKNSSRLAAIFLLLYPVSWYYSVIMLKEGLMVLMLIEGIISIVELQRSFNFFSLIKFVLLIIMIFFFRSAVSILLVIVLGLTFFMQLKRTHIIYNILVTLIVIAVYVYFLKSTGRYDEYYEQYTETDEFFEQRASTVESVNPFVTMVGAPVYILVSVIGPFPSVVVIPIPGNLSHNEYYYLVSGNIYWIILAFFSIYGLYYVIRYNRKTTTPLWAFIIGYQFILLKAMMFTSVRFTFIVKPFLIILAAFGIYNLRNRKWYPLYLAAALVMIVVWNYVRLKGKGNL